MSLRKHQKDMAEVIDSIIGGARIRNVVVKAVPGAGKSMLPIIAGKLITAGLADAICWICPRMSLQNQAERNFIDPFFRDLLQHRLKIRASTNETNPCRGLNGFVTTYQALGVDSWGTVQADFDRKRYILVLDEVHHAAEDGIWTRAISPLYEKAKYRVLMTGTMLRGDGAAIAFVNDGSESANIEYGRRDALSERAILPLTFVLSDGRAEWKTETGDIDAAEISTSEAKKNTYALYTALRTEYAKELLTSCLRSWSEYRKPRARGSLLVVAANIANAKEYTEYLQGLGCKARIATSDDSRDAIEAIKAYKDDRLDILVSVGMAYEGLDVPAITHIACLTNIRSLAWLEQMVGRAVRVDPLAGPYESQQAFIFAPKDRLFMAVRAQIEADQHWAAFQVPRRPKGNNGSTENDQGELFEKTPGGITPLFSQMTGHREYSITEPQPQLQTASEIEENLLERIENHIRQYSFRNRHNPKRINAEVREVMQKPRRDMTIKELEYCLSYVRDTYPLERIRGTGQPRVETKAKPFPCEWRE